MTIHKRRKTIDFAQTRRSHKRKAARVGKF